VTYEFVEADDYWLEDGASEVAAAYRDEIDTNDDTAESIPRHVPWRPAWCDLVRTIRAIQRPVCWEIFAGAAVLTVAFRNVEVNCAPPIDAAKNPDFNVLDAGFFAVLLWIINAHLVDLIRLAPPCSTFSVALNGFAHSRVRSWDHPGGLPNLSAAQALTVKLGNSLAEIAAALMAAQHAAGNMFQLEQPGSQ